MLQIFFFSAIIVSAVLNFAGLIVNLFIAVANYQTWLKIPRISSSNRILFSLGITRFLMLGLFLLNIIYFFISPNVERSVPLSTFFLLCWMFLDSKLVSGLSPCSMPLRQDYGLPTCSISPAETKSFPKDPQAAASLWAAFCLHHSPVCCAQTDIMLSWICAWEKWYRMWHQ